MYRACSVLGTVSEGKTVLTILVLHQVDDPKYSVQVTTLRQRLHAGCKFLLDKELLKMF